MTFFFLFFFFFHCQGGRTFPPKGKPSQLPRQVSSSVSVDGESSSFSSDINQEAEDQLEVELCWCVQQLQTALDSGKLTEKQKFDTNKTLNVLKSNTAPLIKKRQYMRTTFGDYRKKMADDNKKHGKNVNQVKFTRTTSSNLIKKSIFLKKANDNKNLESIDASEKSSNGSNRFRIIPTNDPFKFNFTQPPDP